MNAQTSQRSQQVANSAERLWQHLGAVAEIRALQEFMTAKCKAMLGNQALGGRKRLKVANVVVGLSRWKLRQYDATIRLWQRTQARTESGTPRR